MSHIISDIIEHGDAVKEFRIRKPDGGALPAWSAGAHVQLRFTLPDGSIVERQYSLIGSPGETQEYRIAVLLDQKGRGGSRHLHQQLQIGDTITLTGPFNSFPAKPAQGRVVLIAGGIGVTPLVSIAHAFHKERAELEFHYLARSQERLVLLDDLKALPSQQLFTHLTQVNPDTTDDAGHAERADLAAILGNYTGNAQVYACGPVSLLQDLRRIAALLDWPDSAIHMESFGVRGTTEDKPVQVHLAQSDITVDVAPGTSILDALVDAGAFLSFDCKRGECGNCYTQLVEGDIAHRDVCLTAQQRAVGMCPCVSWANSGRIVLDL
ncbi:PDR/VanB family oxidoreductase [Undibacterium terreum]|uniref:Vanillate O-demethylase ferredoxin subunit n=1 Tax=Undibacterium terreum TaxID=1224302 RepID=A0A916XN17_9BURK|nr:PDR/VanB family oxidoreductase [Undibacterium terreum]GGC84193.1 hypothetical protein GCM10011396_34440 [Undibacterium terreum]